MTDIKKELEKRFVENFALTTQESKEVLDLQKEVAVNVALMELNRPASMGEVKRAIRGDLSPAEFLDPDIEVTYSHKSVWDWLKKDRMNGIIQKRWAVIPRVYTGTDKPIQYAGKISSREQIEEMISLASKEGKRVISSYFGVPFMIGPQIRTVDEFFRSMEVAWYDYHAKMQEKAEKEKLDVAGHSTVWEKRKKENPESAKIAERFGKRIQAEINLTQAKKLTDEIVSRATKFEENYNNVENFFSAGQMLFECWKYGEEFAKIVGFPEDKLKELREKSKDEPSLKKTLDAGMKQDVRKRISSPENC